MENTVRHVSFNHITEEYCQLERLQMMSVAADTDQAYTKVLKNFPNILVGGSITVALVQALANAQDKHALTVLDGIEEVSHQWTIMKRQ